MPNRQQGQFDAHHDSQQHGGPHAPGERQVEQHSPDQAPTAQRDQRRDIALENGRAAHAGGGAHESHKTQQHGRDAATGRK